MLVNFCARAACLAEVLFLTPVFWVFDIGLPVRAAFENRFARPPAPLVVGTIYGPIILYLSFVVVFDGGP